jgi:hypothetical protein
MNENRTERGQKAYELAKQYLPSLGIKGVTPQLIEKYLQAPEKPRTMAELYKHLLFSAQSANMKSGVIGKAIGGIKNLDKKSILCGFQPRLVLEKYKAGWQQLLDDVIEHIKPKGQVRRTSRSIWPNYCETILHGARFLAQFDSADEFHKWVDFFYKDDRARPALPLLLAHQIHGLGFATACDFLKEIGYVKFAKPDVHIRDIFTNLDLCSPDASDYELVNAVVELADSIGVTPFNVDKVFWLIGSGNFYNDQQIGKRGRIGSKRKEFIAYAKRHL